MQNKKKGRGECVLLHKEYYIEESFYTRFRTREFLGNTIQTLQLLRSTLIPTFLPIYSLFPCSVTNATTLRLQSPYSI